MECLMADTLLSRLSDDVSALAVSARALVADVRSKEGHRLTGVLWKPDAVVVSEQATPDLSAYEVEIGGETADAQLTGRDPGTNVAVLKLSRAFSAALPAFAVPKTGALAVIAGLGRYGLSARLAMVRTVGDPWQSMAGGTIDHRILLDARLRAAEEGGPVLAADGGLIGVSARGIRRETLVIPAATVERAVTALLEKGGIERGWLGLALHPVALPEPLRPETGQHVGLMVMDVIGDGPAAKGGVLVGDILLSVDGQPAMRARHVARRLGPDSIGKRIAMTLVRAGTVVTCDAVIEGRKSG
jgi:S1-C subfamily serine protease